MRARHCNVRNQMHFARETNSVPNIEVNVVDDDDESMNAPGQDRGDYNFVPDLDDLVPSEARFGNINTRNAGGSFCERVGMVTAVITNVCLLLFLGVIFYSHILEKYPCVSIYDIIPSYLGEMRQISDPEKLRESEVQNIEHKLKALQREFQTLSRQIDASIKYRSEIEQSFETKQIAEIDDKIQDAIRTYDADKVAMIDYALEYSGATIVSTPNTNPYPSAVTYTLLGGLVNVQPNSNPRLLLQPGTMPGQCYAFYGTMGRVRVRLSARVRITAVTIDHAPPELLDDVGSAPKEMVLYGLESGDADTMVQLGQFTFTQFDRPQTFPIGRGETSPSQSQQQESPQPQLSRDTRGYQFVELSVTSNHGRNEYTCVYRFRVHGDPVP